MMRGRVGAMVYSKGENGSSYVRQYQPQVANPRTDAQLMQRAKMNLAGQISSLTSRGIVKAMSEANNRRCRGRFVKIMLSAMEVTQSGGEYVASLAFNRMVFSRGNAQISAQADTPTLRLNMLDVPLTLTDTSMVGHYGERIVAVSISPRTVADIDFIVASEVLLDVTTTKTCSVVLPHDLLAGQKVHWFRCPFSLSEEGVRALAERMTGATSDDEVQALISSFVAQSSSVWGDSVYGGSVTFTQA